MKINQAGIDLIKSRESCRLKAYKCAAGKWTIGYGVTGDWVHEGLEISQEEADGLFAAELNRFDATVAKTCPESTDCQHSAMVSLAYNIGTGAFAKSSVARLHNAGKFAEAAQAFALWNKGGGKVLPGLVARRAAEATLYLAGADLTETPNGEGEKPLLHSRSINGQAIAGTGISAALGLNEFKDTIAGLIPYVDSFKYVVVALVVFGIAMTLYARWHDRNQGRA